MYCRLISELYGSCGYCVFEVTVAVVRYDALERDRVGVTSTLLAERLQV